MSTDVTPAALTPSSGLPAIPPGAGAIRPPSARLPADLATQVRGENMIRLDSVVFIAACPACSKDVMWAQHRKDMHTHTVVDCRACPKITLACVLCPPAI